MNARVLTVARYVVDPKDSHMRWAVVASFAVDRNSEPRCVDYRVRVVPKGRDMVENAKNYDRVSKAMISGTFSESDLNDLEAFPEGGIPQYVLRATSQAKLIEYARALVDAAPDKLAEASRVIARVPRNRSGNAGIGRPWSRSLQERLAILLDVEEAYARGYKRDTVAKAHAMSDSSLRDLLHWARKEVEPPLFTGLGPGRAGGRLTDHARQLIESGDDNG